ncbi:MULTISPECIES: serine hydrolase [Microcystis]|uniref:serine hydrolase n=1 Tax=Microcystis TaxID=1125 RepID=UPI00168176E5|nr:serine hydrolase [Microcystis wesenbergii FACHB-1339]
MTRQVTRRPTKVQSGPGSPRAMDSNNKKKSLPVKRAKKQRKPNLIASFLLQVLRFSILGVGLGAIAGTVLTVVDPSKLPLHPKPTATNSPTPKPVTPKPTTLVLNENLSSLNQKLQALAVKYPKLQAGALFIDLDNGAYANFRGDTIFAAASTIKIPILVAFFEDVDAGKIRLDETLVATKDVLASGSGDMQYLGVNKTYTALETATKMNVISDNTATNMLIKRMGGKEALNQRFQAWGLTSTVINNALPDLEGTNTTSPRDLVTILGKVNQGELLSLRSRDRLLNIMQETRTRTLLPQGIEKAADIAHKTGDIGSMLADAGIIDMPNGKRYLGAVMVKRPHNDSNARTLIQQISRTAYQHFKWYQTQPAAKPQPVAQSSPSPSPVVIPSPGN